MCMGFKEKANFATALSVVRWEPLYMLQMCEEIYIYYKTIISELMERCFPNKSVTRHTGDKPWITDQFRLLIRKRQRAYIMSGDMVTYRPLRNQVNRAAVRLEYKFY